MPFFPTSHVWAGYDAEYSGVMLKGAAAQIAPEADSVRPGNISSGHAHATGSAVRVSAFDFFKKEWYAQSNLYTAHKHTKY